VRRGCWNEESGTLLSLFGRLILRLLILILSWILQRQHFCAEGIRILHRHDGFSVAYVKDGSDKTTPRLMRFQIIVEGATEDHFAFPAYIYIYAISELCQATLTR
jgi:hypothetical protein